MEQLVRLNDELMQSNAALQAQATQNFEATQMQDHKIAKLQKDLTFYLNKANALEHNLVRHAQNQAHTSPLYTPTSGHDDSKNNKRRSRHSPIPEKATPVNTLQP